MIRLSTTTVRPDGSARTVSCMGKGRCGSLTLCGPCTTDRSLDCSQPGLAHADVTAPGSELNQVDRLWLDADEHDDRTALPRMRPPVDNDGVILREGNAGHCLPG